jgi:uncharacterized protein YndB with AHSA1/START domain
MKKHTIKKSIEINTPKERVWEVLLNPRFVNTWVSEFSEGSQVEADWDVGGTVLYKDRDGNGLKARVADNRPNRLLKVVHEAILNHGVEDPESDDLPKWKGCREAYLLSEKSGVTTLSIESEVPEEYFEPFKPLWDKSLQKIKELAEK